MKNKVYFIIITLLLLSIQGYSNISYKIISSFYKDKNCGNLLLDKIYNLRETKNKEKYLHKIRGGNAHISLIIDTIFEKNVNNPNYEIEVDYINSLRIETFYTFKIEKKYVNSIDFVEHLKIMGDNGWVPLLIWRKTHPNSVENP